MSFRPHVIEATVETTTKDGKPTPLVDFVSHRLASAKRDSQLTALELIELGSVYVNGERSLNPARLLRERDEVRIHSSPRRFQIPSDLAARTIHETQDFIVVEKPAGLPSEATVDNFTENLISAIDASRGQTFYLVHSLETETSGLLMLAKSIDAQTRLKRAFAEGTIKRTFAAFSTEPLAVGARSGFAVRACEKRTGTTDLVVEGKTTWRIESGSLDAFYRIEIEVTGLRPAQLREELAREGAVVIGDLKQGSRIKSIEADTQRASPCLKVIRLTD